MKTFMVLLLVAVGLLACCASNESAVSNSAAARIELACNVDHTQFFRLPSGGLEIKFVPKDGNYTAARACLNKEVPKIVGDPFPVNNGTIGVRPSDGTLMFGE